MQEYTYEQLLALPDLNAFEPEQVYNILGLIFEHADQGGDVEALNKALEFSTRQNFKDFSDYDKMVFHYYVGNGWGYLHRHINQLNSNSFWQFEHVEIENEIINLRKALNFSESTDDNYTKSQILTNLGNTFSHIGRFVEAIQYWKKALFYTEDFPMAVGNLGFGLFHYAKVLYDESHRFIFCHYAHSYLLKALQQDDVYEEAKSSFSEIVGAIDRRYGAQNLSADLPFDEFPLGKTTGEKEYRNWCIRKSLFINPLNDIISASVVAHDCLFLPPITMRLDEDPVYHSMYNQLKQEFVSARYLYYQGTLARKPHFSDKGNMQMDTLDYGAYSLNVEKLKIAFRLCYSLFDKIGYFLNHYLKLGIDLKKATYRGIWYEYVNNKKKGLSPVITNSQNWPLRGLFWLGKDLHDHNSEFSKAILPEAKEIAIIRNYMEHKSFKVVDIGHTSVIDDELTYQITRHDLEKKTFIVMQMARSALIYLSLAIHLEELKKEKGLTIPMSFFELKETFKV